MEYLKTTEVAKRLQVSPNTVLSWITSGVRISGRNHRLDATRIGRNFRIPPDSIERFLAEMQPDQPISSEASAQALKRPSSREASELQRQLRKK